MPNKSERRRFILRLALLLFVLFLVFIVSIPYITAIDDPTEALSSISSSALFNASIDEHSVDKTQLQEALQQLSKLPVNNQSKLSAIGFLNRRWVIGAQNGKDPVFIDLQHHAYGLTYTFRTPRRIIGENALVTDTQAVDAFFNKYQQLFYPSADNE